MKQPLNRSRSELRRLAIDPKIWNELGNEGDLFFPILSNNPVPAQDSWYSHALNDVSISLFYLRRARTDKLLTIDKPETSKLTRGIKPASIAIGPVANG